MPGFLARRSVPFLLGAAAWGCQAVGGYQDFEPAEQSTHPCRALPLGKSDERGVSMMVRVDVPGGTCLWVDKTEVTVEQYARWLSEVAGDAVSWEATWCQWKTVRRDPIDDMNDDCRAQLHGSDVPPFESTKPMRCVDFCEAEAFCRWTGRHLCYDAGAIGIGGPRGFPREWLIACTNQLSTIYPWGNDRTAGHCTVQDEPGVCVNANGVCGPLSAGQQAQCSSQTGIRDLLGNVAEWTYFCNYVDANEPLEPTACLVRGGGYDAPLQSCGEERLLRSDSRLPSLGFRCCADLTLSEKAALSQ